MIISNRRNIAGISSAKIRWKLELMEVLLCNFDHKPELSCLNLHQPLFESSFWSRVKRDVEFLEECLTQGGSSKQFLDDDSLSLVSVFVVIVVIVVPISTFQNGNQTNVTFMIEID